MYPDADSRLTYQTNKSVYYFSGPFDPLCNFSAHTVKIWGHTFNTVEHAFQWKKFATSNPTVAKMIKAAGSPWAAKKIARENYSTRQSNWDSVKVGLMKKITEAKVLQHPDVRDMLLATGNRTIIENSPVDDFWGCGADGAGQNQMGKILMEVRQEVLETTERQS